MPHERAMSLLLCCCFCGQ